MNLRHYQISAIDQLREGFRNHQRQLLVMPTGAGKTITFAAIAAAAVRKGKRVLVLTDRIALLNQTFMAMAHLRPFNITDNPYAELTIGMVETAARRTLPTPNLIIIDEAHKGNFFKILQKHPSARVIGVTATPLHPRLSEFYTNIVEPTTISELINEGYLSPVAPYQIQAQLDGLRTRSGEYTEASQFAAFNKAKIYGQAIDHFDALGRAPALYFCANIEHAKITAKAFGDRAVSITSDDPHRYDKLRAFELGDYQIITNCGILTTGYDHPPIKTIGILRATKSVPLWLQMCGRGARIHPTKGEFVVIDHGNNHTRLGRWDDDRNWTIEKKDKDIGPAPVRLCPKCHAVLRAAATECSFCGHKFEQKEKIQVKGHAVFVEKSNLSGRLASTCSVRELVRAVGEKRITHAQACRIIRSRGMPSLIEFAEIMGYSQGWAFANYRLDKSKIEVKLR